MKGAPIHTGKRIILALLRLRSQTRRTWLMTLSTVLLAATLFEPRWNTTRDAYDLIITLDITQSMNVTDYEVDGQSVSRLEHAKRLLRKTLPSLPCGSRIGWGIFTEYRVLILNEPIDVCENYHELVTTLDNINGRMAWANSSEVTKGFFWGLRNTRELGGDHGFVFMTDGHESPPLSPLLKPIFEGNTSGQGKPYAILDIATREYKIVYDGKPGDIRGLIVGVGNDTPRPIPKFDSEGFPLGFWQAHDVMQTDIYSTETVDGQSVNSANIIKPTRTEHLSAVRTDHLQSLATEAAFAYHHLSDAPALLRALTDRSLARPVPYRADLRMLLAAIALALLALIHVNVNHLRQLASLRPGKR